MGWTCRVDASRLRVDNLRALARWFNAPAARATIGGEAGIRTLDTAFRPYNGLANRRLRPLGHLTPARNLSIRQALSYGSTTKRQLSPKLSLPPMRRSTARIRTQRFFSPTAMPATDWRLWL